MVDRSCFPNTVGVASNQYSDFTKKTHILSDEVKLSNIGVNLRTN